MLILKISVPIIILVTILLLGNSSGEHSAVKKEIIDMHVHSAGIGAGSECFISERMRRSVKYKIFLRSFGV
ncbi:MAG: hypothetical protein AB1442_13135, partial [Nitrospirota bacterium]